MKKFVKNNPSSEYRLSNWDWFAAILLLLALFSTSTRLVITEWTEHLSIIQTLTFIAGICGLALGLSQFQIRKVVSFGIGYASFFISWQLGNNLGEGLLWTEKISSLFIRFISIIKALFSKQEIEDPLLFLLIISIVFWIIGISAGFGLTRKENPWFMIVPAGIAIVLLQAFDSRIATKIWMVAQFLFFSLLLVARVHFLKKERIWNTEKTLVPLYAALNMLPIILGVTIIFILAAWGIPALAEALDPAERAWQKITEPWNEIRDDLDRAFSSIETSIVGFSDIYGSSLSLGRGSIKSESVILEIETPLRVSPFIRYYWRSRSYDYYDPMDQGWESSEEDKQDFLPEELSFYRSSYQDRWESNFNVTAYKPLSILFTTQEPTWVSLPSSLFVNPTNDETDYEINFIKADNPILSDDTYQFKSQVTNTSITNLKAAGTDYPDWVINKYLQLPEITTERTRTLAKSISDGLETPYEIAEAITQYLRDTIGYSEVVSQFPVGVDPIDWLLFDLKQGFCNYYATAEIVLLRSLGIPARLAVGYSHGELFIDLAEEEDIFAKPDQGQSEGGLEAESLSLERYLVRQSDLHAWPEVFFPGIGWVEFEPTLNQEPIERSESSSLLLIGGLNQGLGNDLQGGEEGVENGSLQDVDSNEQALLENNKSTNSINFYISFLLIFFSLLFILYIIRKRKSKSIVLLPFPVLLEKSLLLLKISPPKSISNWSRSAQLSVLNRSYMEINKALTRLKHPQGPEVTPSERAATLLKLIPDLAEEINQLVGQYQITEYSLREGDLKIAEKAGREIRSQSIKIWFQNILVNVKFLGRRIWKRK